MENKGTKILIIVLVILILAAGGIMAYKIMKDKNIDINDMKISELITFIKENPSILKRPIMVDDRRIQVGYNEEEIRTFIPREAREIAFKACSKENCEKFDTCEHAQFKKENGEC